MTLSRFWFTKGACWWDPRWRSSWRAKEFRKADSLKDGILQAQEWWERCVPKLSKTTKYIKIQAWLYMKLKTELQRKKAVFSRWKQQALCRRLNKTLAEVPSSLNYHMIFCHSPGNQRSLCILPTKYKLGAKQYWKQRPYISCSVYTWSVVLHLGNNNPIDQSGLGADWLCSSFAEKHLWILCCYCCFVKVLKQGTRLPRQVVESGPWRYSNPSWTQQHALPNPTLSRWLEYVISRDTCQPQLLCDFVN